MFHGFTVLPGHVIGEEYLLFACVLSHIEDLESVPLSVPGTEPGASGDAFGLEFVIA